MSIFQRSFRLLATSVAAVIHGGEHSGIEFDIHFLRFHHERMWSNIIDVFNTSMYDTRKILQKYVKTAGAQFQYTLFLCFEYDNKEYNDRVMCSWYTALENLSYEEDDERRACVEFFKTQSRDICRQMLDLGLIDIAEQCNFPTCCNFNCL